MLYEQVHSSKIGRKNIKKKVVVVVVVVVVAAAAAAAAAAVVVLILNVGLWPLSSLLNSQNLKLTQINSDFRYEYIFSSCK